MSLEYAGSWVKLGEPDRKRRLLLVLVESRLLQNPRSLPPVNGRATLLSRLNRLVADIRREGNDSRLLSADLYQGRHDLVSATLAIPSRPLPAVVWLRSGCILPPHETLALRRDTQKCARSDASGGRRTR